MLSVCVPGELSLPSTQYLVVLVLFIITELGLAIGAIVKSGSLVGHHCLLPVPHISFLCRELLLMKTLQRYWTTIPLTTPTAMPLTLFRGL